jgi:molecular chaperone DnaK
MNLSTEQKKKSEKREKQNFLQKNFAFLSEKTPQAESFQREKEIFCKKNFFFSLCEVYPLQDSSFIIHHFQSYYMSNTINFGIDLGTTNSLIAKYLSGNVEVFKNPIGLKETLPSVVGFRKERIIVGDKAREYVEKDPANVFGMFKRKMGTDETFFVKTLKKNLSPIELSALVLKELKHFVYSGETLDAVVITIPASFDTIQSNATKKAGHEAGFQEVVLLQEPIAASLAFANKHDGAELTGQWLVYDLGGGTFDVALVRFEDGEMKVVDHEGDNFLGGTDLDALIIDEIIVPHLKKVGTFKDLELELKSSKGIYNKLYYQLLYKAEEVKIQLSNSWSAEIEFEIEDSADKNHEIVLNISRQQFEAVAKPKIDYSIRLIQDLLHKHNLSNKEVEQVILIGGSTYIPLVKKLIINELGIKVNQSVDPTNAVVVGAAYYAGGKTKQLKPSISPSKMNHDAPISTISFKMAYQKTTQDEEEFFMANVTGNFRGHFYRLLRQDGGYDSGLKPLTERISEILPLMKNGLNLFELKVFDAKNNHVPTSVPMIEIQHGKYSVQGQPLPNDICMEIDDFELNTTKLEVIFEKNAILPLKKTVLKTVSKTIPKGSDDALLINILEGSRYATPAACLPLGIVEFKGRDLTMNLVKGSDVEITIEVSESRDLKIAAILLMTDQEMSDVFSPNARTVNQEKLKTEITELLRRARRELNDLERAESFRMAAKVSAIVTELEEMMWKIKNMSSDDVTDLKYQLEERKRRLAQQLDAAMQDRYAEADKSEYFEQKQMTKFYVDKNANVKFNNDFQRITQHEREYLASNNRALIQHKTTELKNLSWQIRQDAPETWIASYHWYVTYPDYPLENKAKVQQFLQLGERALERKNYEELKSVVYHLYDLLPEKEKNKQKTGEDRIKGTGLG